MNFLPKYEFEVQILLENFSFEGSSSKATSDRKEAFDLLNLLTNVTLKIVCSWKQKVFKIVNLLKELTICRSNFPDRFPANLRN